MAGIRKREWINSKGIKKFCYEVSYCIDGKQYRKSGFKTKIEAQEALPNLTKNYAKTITIEELATAYINEHCKIHCKENTSKLYNAYLKNNLARIKKLRAKDVKKRTIDLLILDLKETNLSNKTINNILGFLFSIYSYGIKNRWLIENPLMQVDKLPKEFKQIQFLAEDEIEHFVEVIQGFPIERSAPLITALYTGMRISELLALEWGDVDFKNSTITINKQYYRGQLQQTKTLSSIRKIGVPSVVMNQLRRLRIKNNHNIVFCGKSGNYLNHNKFVANWFKKAVELIGKPKLKFHALRHTYATLLLSKSVSVKFVQAQLGHSTAQTTLNVYSHIMPSVNEKAMEILDKTQNRA